MSAAVLIMVTGLPCTGKSTLARRLAKELGLPLISRDDIKEVLFDSLGWKDRDWSKKLGIASWHLLYYFVELLLSSRQSFVVENYFKPEFDTEELLGLKRRYDFEPFQIHCKTDYQTLLQRFTTRSESAERHPGHVDHQYYALFAKESLRSESPTLEIGGESLDIDTTDLQRIDYAGLLAALKQKLPPSRLSE